MEDRKKSYVHVSNEMRVELIRLINEDNHSIMAASKITGIAYPNAKAIYQTYRYEGRTHKKVHG